MSIEASVSLPFFYGQPIGFWDLRLKEENYGFLLAGSVKSLISMPCFMSHASIPAAVREARGLTEDLIRISVGIEDVNDLITDLDNALRTGPR